jgi:tRNA (guanine37-N1)-methyltransferase
MIGRARDSGAISLQVVNPRDFTHDKHRIVDDYPFGGGSGMVMKPEPLFEAVQSLLGITDDSMRRIILMSPAAPRFTQNDAVRLSRYAHLIFLCGHYEGIDERVREHLADEALSIGDYVLTGGELPAMVITDAIARLIPGVLGAADGAASDSFSSGLLEYPQYTRPREYLGHVVPDVLLSGNHAEIDRWRKAEALKRTLELRPELLSEIVLDKAEKQIFEKIKAEKDKSK